MDTWLECLPYQRSVPPTHEVVLLQEIDHGGGAHFRVFQGKDVAGPPYEVVVDSDHRAEIPSRHERELCGRVDSDDLYRTVADVIGVGEPRVKVLHHLRFVLWRAAKLEA